MDRSCMVADRLSEEYEDEVKGFIRFAIKHATDVNLIPCSCWCCLNMLQLNVEELEELLTYNVIDEKYICWRNYGKIQGGSTSTNMESSINYSETFRTNESDHAEQISNVVEEDLRDCPKMFKRLKDDAKTPLYNGCTKFTRLSSVLKLYNFKASNGWTDKNFTDLLSLLHEMLPEDNVLLKRTYEAKQVLASIGLTHEKIHDCPNDCILFRNEYASLRKCPKYLKLLWDNDIEVFDGFRDKNFIVKAMLYETINDFPAYENLSGYSIRRQYACPICEEKRYYIRLEHCHKNVFMGHRRWLSKSHPFRTMKKAFSGSYEERRCPYLKSGEEIFDEVKHIRTTFGKPFAKQISTAVNGFTFYTKEHDDQSTMQNSGITLAESLYISTAKDRNPIYSNMSYFGVIEHVWELDYTDFHVASFGCKWIDNNSGVQIDDMSFIRVDFKKVNYQDDSFILAS
ncbi:uncharacterized protein LOC113850963 [Abrus precatorius]|uniref:Uncharacterized protein LOC113850963 n=1 Tax=Abrus precatorius TaxID=3816 RepID=A0A8B8K0N2_ABRPR|nr:uncharacterized protein LOC113850963 [Abrus precatorius]